MSDRPNSIRALLGYACTSFFSLHSDLAVAIYMAPGFAFMAALARGVFDFSEKTRVLLMVASFVYLGLPGLLLLGMFLVTGDRRFRLKVLFIVIGIVLSAVIIAFAMSFIAPAPKTQLWD